MTEERRAKIKEAMRQTDAIFRLEGFEPTKESKEIDQAVLDGRITFKQLGEEMVEYIQKHKSIKGFNESREWLKSTL